MHTYSFQFILDTLMELKLLITLHFALRYHYTQERKGKSATSMKTLTPELKQGNSGKLERAVVDL